MVEKRKVLGRGLSALIPQAKREGFLTLSIEQIVPNPFQPRRNLLSEETEELARSIKAKGILEPLIVRRKEGVFQLVSGERRWRAAQKAGLREVPVIVREATDQECLEIALIENLQRADLNPIEEAEGYHSLVQRFELTQEEVAERVFKDRATVANKIRLLKLPERVKDALRAGSITEGHARALLPLDTAAKANSALDTIIRKKLSVRETEAFVRRIKNERHSAASGKREDIHLRAFIDDLQREIRRKVTVHIQRKGMGWLRIYFTSLDDLEDIAERLKK